METERTDPAGGADLPAATRTDIVAPGEPVGPLPGADPLDALTEARRRRALRVLFGTFLATCLLIVGIAWLTDGGTKAQNPEITGTFTARDGTTIDLVALRGTPVVLNFFASWCLPCREELPGFEAASQRFADQVHVIGMNYNETDPEAMVALLTDVGVTFPVALDVDDDLINRVGGTAMPTTAFLDADGRLVDVHSGALQPDDLAGRIEDLLG